MAAGDVAHRPEVDKPAPVVAIHHYVHLLKVAVDQFFLCQKEKGHADIFHNLHFACLGESALS